jgi:hypothetical protein
MHRGSAVRRWGTKKKLLSMRIGPSVPIKVVVRAGCARCTNPTQGDDLGHQSLPAVPRLRPAWFRQKRVGGIVGICNLRGPRSVLPHRVRAVWAFQVRGSPCCPLLWIVFITGRRRLERPCSHGQPRPIWGPHHAPRWAPSPITASKLSVGSKLTSQGCP